MYRTVLFFARFIKPFRAAAALVLFLTAISTTLSSLLPFSSKMLVDFVLLKTDPARIDQFIAQLHLGFAASAAKAVLQSPRMTIGCILNAGGTVTACSGGQISGTVKMGFKETS